MHELLHVQRDNRVQRTDAEPGLHEFQLQHLFVLYEQWQSCLPQELKMNTKQFRKFVKVVETVHRFGRSRCSPTALQRVPDHSGVPTMGICQLLMWVVVGTVQAACDDELEARWRREYPAAANSLEATSHRFLAKGTNVTRYFHKPDVTITEEFTVAASDGKEMFLRDRRFVERPGEPRKAISSDVVCVAPTYAFALRKNSVGEPYFIEQFGPTLGTEPIFRAQYNTYARAATLGGWLVERMQSPEFELRAIKWVPDSDGANLVEVVYKYRRPGNSQAIEEGSVFLNADLGWALRKADFVITNNGDRARYTWDVLYSNHGPGRYFPKRVEGFVRGDDPNNFQHELVEYSSIQLDNIPEEIFTLTAYGLPDVPLSPRLEPPFFSPANPIFWGLIAIAAVSLLLLRLLRANRTEPVRESR